MPNYKLPKLFHPDFSQPGVKPRNAVVDWENSLTSGLKSFFLLHGLHDSITNESAENYNGGATKTPQGYSFDGTNDLIKIDSDAYDASKFSIDGYSVVVRVKANAAFDRRFFCVGDSTNNEFIGIGTTSISPFKKLRVYTTLDLCDRDYSGESVGEIADGDWHTIVYSIGEGSQRARIYIDGQLDTDAATNGVAATTNATYAAIGAMRRNGNPNGASFFDGEVALCGFYHRELSIAEGLSLSRDPYQILKPAVPITYFTGSVGGGTTVNTTTGTIDVTANAATVNDATAITGTTPAVNVSSYTATVSLGLNISATVAGVDVTSYASTINDATAITSILANANVSTHQAVITAGNDVNISATVGSVNVVTFSASLSYTKQITASLSGIDIVTFRANVVDSSLVFDTPTERLFSVDSDDRLFSVEIPQSRVFTV